MVYDLLNPDVFDLYGEDGEFFDCVEVSVVSPVSVRAWAVSGRLVTSLAPDVLEHSVNKFLVVCAYGVFGSYPHSVAYLAQFDRICDALNHVSLCADLTRHVFHSGVEYEIWYVSPSEEWKRYEREVEYSKPNEVYVLDCPSVRMLLTSRSDIEQLLCYTHCFVGDVKSELIPPVSLYPGHVPVEHRFLRFTPSCRYMRDAADDSVFIGDVSKWIDEHIASNGYVFADCIPF